MLFSKFKLFLLGLISPTMLIYTNCRLFIAAFNDFHTVPTYIAYNIYPYHGKYIRPFLNALVYTAYVYIFGISVVMLWVIDLLQLLSKVRLQNLTSKVHEMD